MKLTNDEITCAITIVTCVVTISHSSVIAWLNIKAQHVKSIDEITEYMKTICIRFLLWIGNLSALGILAMELFSSAPVTRRDVFLIVWGIVILFLSLLLKLGQSLFRFTTLFGKQLELINTQRKHTERIMKMMEDRNKQSNPIQGDEK